MNEFQDLLVSQLRTDVESICLPEGRRVGSPGHRRAREILCGAFARWAASRGVETISKCRTRTTASRSATWQGWSAGRTLGWHHCWWGPTPTAPSMRHAPATTRPKSRSPWLRGSDPCWNAAAWLHSPAGQMWTASSNPSCRSARDDRIVSSSLRPHGALRAAFSRVEIR